MEQEQNTDDNLGETDVEQPCPTLCGSCGGRPRWESTVDGWGERWLATCACGRIETFFPDRRQRSTPSDPLTLFLQGHLAPRRPVTPPWIRLFLNSIQAPYPIHWRHAVVPCEACQSSATFGMLARPQPYLAAICTVCLQCGYVTTSQTNTATGAKQPVVDGSSWTPACPAVQRLRDYIYKLNRDLVQLGQTTE